MTTSNGRTADYPIDPIFLNRWSPRSFTGETISDADLALLFEAARWAPSSSNIQPWRFLYAKRDGVVKFGYRKGRKLVDIVAHAQEPVSA